ncbi:unnamed protein product [Amaranthus hypochondriacus]
MIGWSEDHLKVEVYKVHLQFVHCKVTIKANGVSFWLTSIYGLNTIVERKELWSELVEISQAMVDPCLIQGDFNAMFEHNQRLNGRPVSNYKIKDFVEFIHDAHLIVPRSVGHWFSWHNKAQGDDRIASRINHGFFNRHWLNQGWASVFQYLNHVVSDHTPLVFPLAGVENKGGRPFRYFNYLSEHPEFQKVIQGVWDKSYNGRAMHRLWEKLKKVKGALKGLHTNHYQRV